MALKYAGIEVQHREIELRNKPKSMLMASPKGTVPVLIIGDVVLDQSIEIMRWALQKSDPDNWGGIDEDAAQIWIERNDVAFKTLLDQYKYSNRNPHLNQGEILDTAIALMLKPMNDALEARQYLLGNQQSWIDVAIFPFVRQFSMVNRDWFDQLPFPALKRWLANYLQSELFNAVMHKHPTWTVWPHLELKSHFYFIEKGADRMTSSNIHKSTKTLYGLVVAATARAAVYLFIVWGQKTDYPSHDVRRRFSDMTS